MQGAGQRRDDAVYTIWTVGCTWAYELECADRRMVTYLLKVYFTAIVQSCLPCLACANTRALTMEAQAAGQHQVHHCNRVR